MSLSERDKTPNPSGWGKQFHHTNPQRHVQCVLGDMLAPRSADDIAPITPEAMASVQAALTLLANLVGDRDLGRFLGDTEDKLEEHRVHANVIQNAARGLTGILRVEAIVEDVVSGLGAQITALEGDLDYERGRNAMLVKTLEHYPGSAEADRLELRAELRAEREKVKQLEAQMKILLVDMAR